MTTLLGLREDSIEELEARLADEVGFLTNDPVGPSIRDVFEEFRRNHIEALKEIIRLRSIVRHLDQPVDSPEDPRNLTLRSLLEQEVQVAEALHEEATRRSGAHDSVEAGRRLTLAREALKKVGTFE